MIIDDSKTIRWIAETLLKKTCCQVVTATDGFDVLAKIAASKSDVIFVDIMMPWMASRPVLSSKIKVHLKRFLSSCYQARMNSLIVPEDVLPVQIII